MKHTVLFSLVLTLLGSLAHAEDSAPAKLYSGSPVKALLITGGCCHNYEFQSKALVEGAKAYADIDWTVVNAGGTTTRGEIELYNDPDWAKNYDVVVHNECFADTNDKEYIAKIVNAHQGGTPAVVIHCAMHTYRAAEHDLWREFLGVESRHHEHQSHYPVKIVKPQHPIMQAIPGDWVTAMDELYIIKKTWPSMTPLATSKSEKTGEEQPVVWVNSYHGIRVFGTTYGHSDDTFRDPVFIKLVSRGLLWSSGHLPE